MFISAIQNGLLLKYSIPHLLLYIYILSELSLIKVGMFVEIKRYASIKRCLKISKSYFLTLNYFHIYLCTYVQIYITITDQQLIFFLKFLQVYFIFYFIFVKKCPNLTLFSPYLHKYLFHILQTIYCCVDLIEIYLSECIFV